MLELVGTQEETGAMPVDFSEFVAARYGSLLGMAYLLTHDHALAEDLVQTALAKCWRSWGAIRADDPSAYVRRVLLNTYRAWWRTKKGKREFPTEVLPSVLVGSDSVDSDYDNVDSKAVLVDALARLPRRMRTVVVLRYLGDLTEAETAATVGCAVGTIKSQTSRALAKLRQDPTLNDFRHPPLAS
ncbi:MAG TPA: SigE family RNA polymerase sigma factor [Kribbella sp.]|uniref:SigE family RNA polymerase sigma factor n=1 Tax=Kribbella sp. TaxID=1871183 RepID=UPI002D7917BA|nr:SigE family RNA polymerase sigma factor [Kribbella sp.]HET6293989.1 SigE family RNA polymerase sigma factor [Kribbella sp.]